MRDSLAHRDVIVYGGHSGPFYGFALANWRMTDEGDLDDSELASVQMPSDRYQIVVADGCDTYQIGAAFGRNPAHPDLANLDVVTTTSFSDASEPTTIQDFITRLIERDGYRIGAYRLTPEGCCPGCGTRLPGVFAAAAGTWGARRLPVRLAGFARPVQ